MAHHLSAEIDQRRPLGEILALLVERRATGTLAVRSRAVTREIVLVDGAIHAVRSDADEEKVGGWLVRRRGIDDYDIALALLAQGTEGLPLGHRLVSRGLIDVASLRYELEELGLHIVRKAASEPMTQCDLHADGGCEARPTLVRVPARRVIMEASRVVGESAARRTALGDESNVVRRAGDLPRLVGQVALTPAEAYVLDQLDRTPTVKGLIGSMGLPRAEMLSALYTLLTAGLIEVVADPTPPRSKVGRESEARDSGARASSRPELRRWEIEEQERVRRLAEESRTWGHYEVLDLPRDATPEAIAEAWQTYQHLYSVRRASEDHLRGWEDRLARILERAGNAFKTLSDPKSRQRYDELLAEAVDEAFEFAERDDLLATLAGGAAPSEAIATYDRVEDASEDDARKRKARDSEEADQHFAGAEQLLGRGETEEAVRLLEQACTLDPRPAELVKLARLLLAEPKWTNRALTTLHTALETDRECVEAWLELARFWQGRGDRDRQRRALEGALSAAPRNDEARAMYRELMGHADLIQLLRRLLGTPND